MPSNHAQVSPKNFTLLVKKHWSMHVHRCLLYENFEHLLVVCKHRLRYRGHLRLLILTDKALLRCFMRIQFKVWHVHVATILSLWTLIDRIKLLRILLCLLELTNLHLVLNLLIQEHFVINVALLRLIVATGKIGSILISWGIFLVDVCLEQGKVVVVKHAIVARLVHNSGLLHARFAIVCRLFVWWIIVNVFDEWRLWIISQDLLNKWLMWHWRCLQHHLWCCDLLLNRTIVTDSKLVPIWLQLERHLFRWHVSWWVLLGYLRKSKLTSAFQSSYIFSGHLFEVFAWYILCELIWRAFVPSFVCSVSKVDHWVTLFRLHSNVSIAK